VQSRLYGVSHKFRTYRLCLMNHIQIHLFQRARTGFPDRHSGVPIHAGLLIKVSADRCVLQHGLFEIAGFEVFNNRPPIGNR